MFVLPELKFIFLCYPHGAGGEFLSYIISKSDECNTLDRRKIGDRYKVDDIFNQNLLRLDFKPERLHDHKDISTIDKDRYVVVPTHYREDDIWKYFKNYKFINIIYPASKEGHKQVLHNIKRKVWDQPQPTQLEFFGMLQQLTTDNDRSWYINTHYSMNTIDIILASRKQELSDKNRKKLMKEWDKAEYSYHSVVDRNLNINYDDLDARQQYVPSQSRVLKQISKHCGIVMRDEIHQEFRAKIENDKQI